MSLHRLNESERQRILNLHESATKKQYLTEQKGDGSMMKASQDFWDNIKFFEGNARMVTNGVKEPMLKAYKDTKGIWTIGYGHTGPEVKNGLKITKDDALKLLYSDAKEAADCVRRIFKEWKQKELPHQITQGMFDALVSLVFNAGCDGVRTSDFIQDMKNGDYDVAAEKILTFKPDAGEERRNKEREMFLS